MLFLPFILDISCPNGISIEVMDGSKDEYRSGLEDSKLDLMIWCLQTVLNVNASRLITRIIHLISACSQDSLM